MSLEVDEDVSFKLPDVETPVAESNQSQGKNRLSKSLVQRHTSTADDTCIFCFRSEDDEFRFGKFYRVEVEVQGRSMIRAHLYCLFFASGLCQNGAVTDGIQGFMPNDIMKEVNRARRLKCAFCKKIGASIGCCIKKCKQCYHFPCGRENQSLFHFYGSYESYCCKHLPQQKQPEGGVSLNTSIVNCPVCLDSVPNEPSFDVLKTPCCHNTFLHRDCIQHQALSSGFYFFRCPICNNQKEFRDEMLAFGVHVPEQDASWERDEGAYQELYERHKKCDVDCQCPKGREYTTAQGQWQIVLCDFCGSVGCHVYCGGLEHPDQDWACHNCRAILSSDSTSGLHLESTPCKDGARARNSMKLKGKTPRSGIKKKKKKRSKSLSSSKDYADTDSPSTSKDGIFDTPKQSKKKRKKKCKTLDETPPVLHRVDLSPPCSARPSGPVRTPKLSPITNYFQVKTPTGNKKKSKSSTGNTHSKDPRRLSKSKSGLLSTKGSKMVSKGGMPLSHKGGKLKRSAESGVSDNDPEEAEEKENDTVPPVPRVVFFSNRSRLFQHGKVMENTVDSHHRFVQRSLARVGNQVDLPLVRLSKLAFPPGSATKEVMAWNWRRAILRTTLAYQEKSRGDRAQPGKCGKRRVTWSRMRMVRRSPLKKVQLQKPVKDVERIRPTRAAVSIINLMEETLQESPSQVFCDILDDKKSVDLFIYLAHKEAELGEPMEQRGGCHNLKAEAAEGQSSSVNSNTSIMSPSKPFVAEEVVLIDPESDGTDVKMDHLGTLDSTKPGRRPPLGKRGLNDVRGSPSKHSNSKRDISCPTSPRRSPRKLKSMSLPNNSPEPNAPEWKEFKGTTKSDEVSPRSLFVVKGVTVKSREQLAGCSTSSPQSSKGAGDRADSELPMRLSGSSRKRRISSLQTSEGGMKKTIGDYFKVTEKSLHLPTEDDFEDVGESPMKVPRNGISGRRSTHKASTPKQTISGAECIELESTYGGISGEILLDSKKDNESVPEEGIKTQTGASTSTLKHNKRVYALSTPSNLWPHGACQNGQILTRLMSAEDTLASGLNTSFMTPSTPPQKELQTSSQYTWPQGRTGASPRMAGGRHACSQVKRTSAGSSGSSKALQFPTVLSSGTSAGSMSSISLGDESNVSAGTRSSIKRKLSTVEGSSESTELVSEKEISPGSVRMVSKPNEYCLPDPVTGKVIKKFKRDISADFSGLTGSSACSGQKTHILAGDDMTDGKSTSLEKTKQKNTVSSSDQLTQGTTDEANVGEALQNCQPGLALSAKMVFKRTGYRVQDPVTGDIIREVIPHRSLEKKGGIAHSEQATNSLIQEGMTDGTVVSPDKTREESTVSRKPDQLTQTDGGAKVGKVLRNCNESPALIARIVSRRSGYSLQDPVTGRFIKSVYIPAHSSEKDGASAASGQAMNILTGADESGGDLTSSGMMEVSMESDQLTQSTADQTDVEELLPICKKGPASSMCGGREERLETTPSNQEDGGLTKDITIIEGKCLVDDTSTLSCPEKSGSISSQGQETSQIDCEESIFMRSSDQSLADDVGVSTDKGNGHPDDCTSLTIRRGPPSVHDRLKLRNAGIGVMFYRRNEGTPQKRILTRRPLSLSKIATPYHTREQTGFTRMCVSESKVVTPSVGRASKRHLVMS